MPHCLRELGQNGPMVEAVGLGLMGMSIAYGTKPSDEERLQLLDHAWATGCTHWDTANVYGDSEDLLGQWFRRHPERRPDIFLATKFGAQPTDAGAMVIDATADSCRRSIARSLERLGVDYVDLYYLHRPHPDVPIEQSVRAMKALVESGQVRYLGLSEPSSTTLRRAYAVHPIAAVQMEYSPWTLDMENAAGTFLKQTCDELGVAIVAYAPLGRGLLAGRHAPLDAGDARRRVTRYQGDHLAQNLHLVDALRRLAARRGCTVGQLVLAWTLAQGPRVFVIPGTHRPGHLDENVAAAAVPLTADDEQALRALVAEVGVSGHKDSFFGSYVDTAEE